ncbi:MAG TPA: Wzz/FepE/Etk N-terminal domain-containing protein [Mycobacteriales bacterium]|nr:Wzz/FepE/Etk N-terminal domain-containing protein [Mycobacteriales bacterium]
MASQSGGNTLQLGDYLRLARRRWWAIALGLLVGLSAGYAFTATRSPEYTSTATVLVAPVSTDSDQTGGRTTGTVNLDTEAQLVRSSAVETKARDLLRTSISPQDLGESVKVTVPANTTLMEIAFTADNPAGAQQGAHAFAEAYLQNRGDVAKADNAARAKALKTQIASLVAQQKTLTGQIAALPVDSPDRAFAQAQLNNVTDQISTAAGRLVPLNDPVEPGNISTDAVLPDSASGPLGILAIASGLLLGLLFGLMLAFAIERADRRVRRSVDLEREFDVPVLVEVPTGARTDFSMVQSTHSRQGNAFSELRNVLVSLVSDREQIILVAGASDGPAGSIVAANLAVSLARMNLDTVLVCADPDSSGRQILDLDPEAPGLSELLHGGINVSDLEQRPAAGHGLRVIPPGVEAELTSEATQVFLTEQAIRQFRHSARFVVIDAPPMSSGSQAQTLARLAHVTVLVVELGATTNDQVLRASRLIDLVGTRSIGMVTMPRVPVRREKRTPPAPSTGSTTAGAATTATRSAYSAPPAPSTPDRYGARSGLDARSGADRYGSTDERYDDERYGAAADDLTTGARTGAPALNRRTPGSTNGHTNGHVNGSGVNGTGYRAVPADDTAADADLDEPTRTITRPAAD